MSSSVEICSQALELLGETPIGSFEDSEAAETAGRLYDTRINTLLGLYPWRFAQRTAQLQRLTATPDQEWKFAHRLGGEQVVPGLLALKATAEINAPTIKDFEIFGAEVRSNYQTLFAEFTARPPEAQWPPHFFQLAIYAIAEHLAIPVTEDAGKAEYWRTIAFGTPGDDGNGGFFRTARHADARQQPAQQIEDFSLIDARFNSLTPGGLR